MSAATPRTIALTAATGTPEPDAAYQLRIGRPSKSVVDAVWQTRFSDVYTLPPYEFHWKSAAFIRRVSLRIQEFIFHYRSNPALFSVIVDMDGAPKLFASPSVFRLIDLCIDSSENVMEVAKLLPQHRFHPLFNVYAAVVHRNKLNENIHDFQLFMKYFAFGENQFNQNSNIATDIYSYRDRLNILCKEFYREAISLNEKIKSFRRTAQEARRSVMRYAEHFVRRAPKPYISHFAIYRRSGVQISYDEICDLRKRLTKMIKSEIPKDIYLGYSILLRHNTRIGFWLDVFVFLQNDNPLREAGRCLEEFIYSWQVHVNSDDAVCVGHSWSIDEGYKTALEVITMATEFDFYCRAIPANRDRSFWCGQSPIGKLAERTRIRKRSAKKAAHNQLSPDKQLVQDLIQESVIRQAQDHSDAWSNGKKRKQRTISKRRIQAAETRRRKQKVGDSTP